MSRIAVIGAGLSGMAAAARLATAGHQVVVHERGAVAGGAVGRFERDGFAFDTGPGLLVLPAVYRDLFVKTGREPLESLVDLVQTDPAARHVLPDGTSVALPNASRAGVLEALDGAFGPGSGERWDGVQVRAREVWEATRRPLLEDVPADLAALAADPYPGARRRGLLRRSAPTLADVAARELGDPRLAALLESHALACGLDPRTAPASAAVLAYLEQSFGVWYVRGGMRALAEALYARCRARKVEFRFVSSVAEVAVEGGRSVGIASADGAVEPYDTVVAAAALPSLCAPGGPLAAPGGGPAFRGPAGEPGRFTVHVALRGSRPAGAAHRTVVHAADRERALEWLFPRRGREPLPPEGALTVTVLRPDDPALRPDSGHEAVTVSAVVPPHVTAGAGGAAGTDWTDGGLAESFAERVLGAAEAAVPGLRERELWREVRTPADTERELGVAGGSVPPPSLAGAAGALFRAGNRSAVPGLFLAGGWAHPGGGLPHAGMAAAITASLVTGGPGGSR